MNVGVLDRGLEPFVYTENDKYSGICIEIWERAADKLNIDYKYISVPNKKTAIEQIVSGKLDILIGPFSIKESDYQQVDFTTPFI